jgi:hypothetical protein
MLSFTSPEKDFFFIFMKSLLQRKKKNALNYTTGVESTESCIADLVAACTNKCVTECAMSRRRRESRCHCIP